ncbi:uncharacterized protein [Dermacentor albipictus]|uniref:uncharacterized protein n=1 Tax=Dermacentor albipictus TaxID=60249 RepID=UPI0038FC5E7A
MLKAPNPHNKKELQSYLGLINFYGSFQPICRSIYSRSIFCFQMVSDGQLETEGLALMFGAERFHQYLWGRKFEAFMAHKPLLGLLWPDKAVPVQASPRVVRWALKLADYIYQLVYRPRKNLGPADALSRLTLPEVLDAVPKPREVYMLDYAYSKVLSRSAVSQATTRDPVLPQVVKTVCRGEELVQQAYSHNATEISCEQGCLLCGSSVVIPQSLRSRVLQVLHAGHSGFEKTKMVARSHVSCPGLDQDIAHMAQSFQIYQEHQQASRHVEITTWPFPLTLVPPACAFLGPFKDHHFLLVVDAFPNLAAERVVQTIKDKLKKSQTGDFRTQIDRILFQYRTTPHDVTGRASCELLLGRMANTPLDVLHPDVQSTVLLKQLKQKLAADRGCRSGPFPESGAPVFARNFRPDPPWSSGQVVAPASASSLLGRMPDGATWHRHADDVRPHHGTWPVPSSATSEFLPARGLEATPVASSGSPPNAEVESVASGAAPIGLV